MIWLHVMWLSITIERALASFIGFAVLMIFVLDMPLFLGLFASWVRLGYWTARLKISQWREGRSR